MQDSLPLLADTACVEFDVAAVKRLLLDMAHERSVDSLLKLIVTRLDSLDEVALARVWLVEPGDLCESCRLRTDCPDQETCLHLAASTGGHEHFEGDWKRTDGNFRRIPIGYQEIGQIASTHEPIDIRDVSGDSWLIDEEWDERAVIRGFVGQPLLSRDELVGVLGVYLRVPCMIDALTWIRMVADHAASSIANARAFEEIERLRGQLALENEYLRDEVKVASGHCSGIVGESSALQKVMQQVQLVAPTDSTVLILGESGVGKELVARAVHDRSQRANGPMIKVNCAALPESLFESEFFGHVKGAFTGAEERIGRFEFANGGTLFLDEVGEIPLEVQGKLLRVLQEGTYERLGGNQTRNTNVRIVAATNRNLEDEVAAKRFREDLYYRLSVFPIHVIPLRERKEDIPLLVSCFLESRSRNLGLPTPKLTEHNIAQLQHYDWPGNIRELQNVLERAIIASRNEPLRFDLPLERRDASQQEVPQARTATIDLAEGVSLLTDQEVRQMERDNILAVLRQHNWKISGEGGAANFLGLHPATLTSRMKSMDIRRAN